MPNVEESRLIMQAMQREPRHAKATPELSSE